MPQLPLQTDKDTSPLPGTAGTYNLNIGENPQSRKELDDLSLMPPPGEGDIEAVLGSVHISKPSIQHVFFLLRPIMKPILARFNALEEKLTALMNDTAKSRVFFDTPVALSTSVGYTVDYVNRKFLYIMTMNPNSPALLVGGNLLPGMDLGKWYPIEYPRGMTITCSVPDSAPVTFIVRACDYPLAQFVNLISGSTISLVTGSGTIGNVTFQSEFPKGAGIINATSGNVANAVATCTLPGAAGVRTFLTGFEVTGSGATAALVVTVTVSDVGLLHTYIYTFVAGVLLGNTPLIIEFTKPLRSSTVNQAITIVCGASGAGGTNNTINARGYTV